MDKYTIAPPAGSTNNSVGAEDRPWKEGHFDSVKLNGGDLGEYLAESTGYGIVSGCEPSISGLTVTVGAGVVHLADGTRKEIVQTSVTLDSADPTNQRIDLVYINADGVVAKVTGTTAASPSAPSVPSQGISVCTVSVAAGAVSKITLSMRMTPSELEPSIGSDKNIYAFKHIASTNAEWSGYYPQGMDYNAKDGILYVAGIKTGAQRIFRYSVTETNDRITDVTLIDYVDYTNLGHCNSVAYCIDTDKIYVTNELEDKSFTVINASTMAIETTTTLAVRCYNLTYDAVKKVFVVLDHYNPANNNTMWVFVLYDTAFNEIRRFSVYSGYNDSVGNINGLCSYNGRIINVNGFSITEIDFYGHILKQFPLYTGIEFEAICRIGDKYMMSGVFWGYSLVLYEFDKNRDYVYSFAGKNSEILYLGTYNLSSAISNGVYYVTAGTNFPSGVTNGILIVRLVKPANYWKVNIGTVVSITQTLICTDDTSNRVYQRTMANDTWGNWARIDAGGAVPYEGFTDITISTITGTYTPTEDGWLTVFAGGTSVLGVAVFPSLTSVGQSDHSPSSMGGTFRYASIPANKHQTIEYRIKTVDGTDAGVNVKKLRFVPYCK